MVVLTAAVLVLSYCIDETAAALMLQREIVVLLAAIFLEMRRQE